MAISVKSNMFCINHLLETEDDYMRNAEIKRRLISELSLAVKEVCQLIACPILVSGVKEFTRKINLRLLRNLGFEICPPLLGPNINKAPPGA